MGRYNGYTTMLKRPEELIRKLENNLQAIDPDLCTYIDFEKKIQRDNLLDFVQDAEARIDRYEQIYPFIKELCTDQQINPLWYNKIEKVLEWALKKGRGPRKGLPEEIKDAWVTYMVVLSCSMIDKKKGSGNIDVGRRESLTL